MEKEHSLTRREVLRKAVETVVAGATATLVAEIVGPAAHLYIRDTFDEKTSLEELEKAKDRIKKRHGVSVNVELPTTLPYGLLKLTITPNDSAYIRMCAVREFERIANIYPPDTLGRFFSNVHIGEIPEQAQAGGFLTMDGTSIIIGMWPLFNSYDALTGSLISISTSHHEIGHGLTKNYIFSPQLMSTFEKVNPPDFFSDEQEEVEPLYLGHLFGVSEYALKVNDPIPGFVRAYGIKTSAEDIATIVELLFRGQKAVQDRLSLEDEKLASSGRWRGILRNKIDKVKEIIKTHVPEMDEQFWQDIATEKMKDPIAYWNARGVLPKNS